jgi:hypothetical protein
VDQATRSLPSRLFRALAWLVVAMLVSLGAAGLATAADHPAGDATRPELTYLEDRRLEAQIERMRPLLVVLSDDMDHLGETARQALVDLVARREDLLSADLARGGQLASAVASHRAAVQAAAAGLPSPTAAAYLGEGARDRISAAEAASAAVTAVPDSWRRLSDGVLPAIRLAAVLQEHDRLTFGATQAGVHGRYPDALAKLALAGAQLDQARSTRDRLAGIADVTTLSQWIDRAAGYDDSLRRLYGALTASRGKVTAEVKTALAATTQAQALLPANSRALVVIMGDIAQAGLNAAAIEIEQARGDLAAAIAALH